MNSGTWLRQSTNRLQNVGIATARLDCLVLLADLFEQDKSWVLAHTDIALTSSQHQVLEEKLTRRLRYEPLAYIRGVAEFYGRAFSVTRDVLIPRPETETLITQLLDLPYQPGDTLLDVGTGSGCIAITAKLERRNLVVHALDSEPTALGIAAHNAQLHDADITFIQANLFPTDGRRYTFIAANLPYVGQSWQRSPETNFEPASALFADEGGLQLINQLIIDSPAYLALGGYILLEADPRQHDAIIKLSASHFRLIARQNFIIIFQYIT